MKKYECDKSEECKVIECQHSIPHDLISKCLRQCRILKGKCNQI